nr:transposase [Streptomyces sasae]
MHDAVRAESLTVLSQFRTDFYDCLTARADALFELTDAVLCTDGPVRSLVDLALAPEHRRGHGSLYAGLNRGGLDVARLRRALAGVPLPRAAGGRLVLAVDVSPWLRPDAGTVPDRSFCHTYGRGNAKHQMMPGWPYSVVVALETGRTSWSALLDAVRLTPGADLAAVTARQVREVVERLVAAGQWTEGDPDILIVLDAGYDAPRIYYLLSGLPVEVLGRTRSDRVMRRPAPSREEFFRAHPKGGRLPKHGGEFVFGDPATWGQEQAATVTDTRLYGKATAQAWDRLHPRLTQRAAWLDHDGPLPVIEGTVIRLAVEHLPSGGVNKPVWLWWSRTGATVLVCGGVSVALRHLSVSGAGEVAWSLTLTGSAHPLLPGAAKSHVILTLTTSNSPTAHGSTTASPWGASRARSSRCPPSPTNWTVVQAGRGSATGRRSSPTSCNSSARGSVTLSASACPRSGEPSSAPVRTLTCAPSTPPTTSSSPTGRRNAPPS